MAASLPRVRFTAWRSGQASAPSYQLPDLLQQAVAGRRALERRPEIH